MGRKTEVGVPPCEYYGGCSRAALCRKYHEDCWSFRYYVREGVDEENWPNVLRKRQQDIKPLIDNPLD